MSKDGPKAFHGMLVKCDPAMKQFVLKKAETKKDLIIDSMAETPDMIFVNASYVDFLRTELDILLDELNFSVMEMQERDVH